MLIVCLRRVIKEGLTVDGETRHDSRVVKRHKTEGRGKF
jgi:hypothetical protein